MTQTEFGKLAGVTYQTVSDWEGEVTTPPRSRLRMIAERVNGPLAMFEEGGPRAKDVVKLKPVSVTAGIPYESRPAAPVGQGALAAERLAKDIIAERLALRMAGGISYMPIGEAIESLAAVGDAAAGRPVRLPPLPRPVEGDQLARETVDRVERIRSAGEAQAQPAGPGDRAVGEG